MKKILLVVTLSLFAAATARSQQKAVEFRTGDVFIGHVKSARIETAHFSKVDGAIVEGPRRLSVAVSYSPDGKMKEEASYAPDGSLRNKYVYVYDDSGNRLEQSNYGGQNNLHSRFVYRPDTGETFTYDGEGKLQTHRQVILNERREPVEVRTYDGSGGLLKSEVNTRDADKSVWRTYRADGSLEREAVHSLNYGGPHHSVERSYNPDGSISGRRVSDADASVNNLEAVVEKKDGTPREKRREKREYGSHRNLTKLTRYAWDDAANDFVPSVVYYYVIDYYD
jgi:antitoxin component YwqK of YwqJK toxin-antitoxin module